MLKAEEVQAILRVYDHLEKYIRNNFPTLSDDEVMRKLQDSLRSRPLRKYLEEKDEIDEVRIRANPGLDIKRWYER